MRSIDRFDTRLPQLLDELSQPRTPDWFDDFVGLTARTRQRPAWTLPERWLSMTEIARQPVLAPRLPLRSVAIGLLILALALATLFVVVAGNRRTPAPPFGLAKTGLVAFDRDGDIFVADPTNGTERAIVTGPTYDVTPVWSRDGARLAFERRANRLTRNGKLMVADADGSNAVVVTPAGLININRYTFSPDGKQILVTTGQDATSVVYVASLDGSAPRQLRADMIIEEPDWRPPDGREIAFVGNGIFETNGSEATGIYAMDVETGKVRTVRDHVDGHFQGQPHWSPDGTKLLFSEWTNDPIDLTVDAHIVAADGTGERMVQRPDGTKWQYLTGWSNDGDRLVGVRGYTGGFEDVRGAVVPADGSGTGVEMTWAPGVTHECCPGWEFAPDDSFVLGVPTNSSGQAGQQLVVDPSTGAVREARWTATSNPAIQRLAR